MRSKTSGPKPLRKERMTEIRVASKAAILTSLVSLRRLTVVMRRTTKEQQPAVSPSTKVRAKAMTTALKPWLTKRRKKEI